MRNWFRDSSTGAKALFGLTSSLLAPWFFLTLATLGYSLLLQAGKRGPFVTTLGLSILLTFAYAIFGLTLVMRGLWISRSHLSEERLWGKIAASFLAILAGFAVLTLLLWRFLQALLLSGYFQFASSERPSPLPPNTLRRPGPLVPNGLGTRAERLSPLLHLLPKNLEKAFTWSGKSILGG